MVDLAGRWHRVGTTAARHSDRVDVVPMVLVTPQSGFAALVEWYVAGSPYSRLGGGGSLNPERGATDGYHFPAAVAGRARKLRQLH